MSATDRVCAGCRSRDVVAVAAYMSPTGRVVEEACEPCALAHESDPRVKVTRFTPERLAAIR